MQESDYGALFSKCGRYRYLLWRTLRQRDVSAGSIVWLMLNPSTADASSDDPTIRRCLGFTRAWGYRRLLVVNLFAWRTGDPAKLAKARAPIGIDNDRAIATAANSADRVVCAWGVHGTIRERDQEVRALLETAGVKLHHLGLTKAGQPRHPLYLAASTLPVRWKARVNQKPLLDYA